MIEFGKKGTDVAEQGYEPEKLTLEILSTLQSANLIVSSRPFRIEMKKITPEDVTIINNLFVPVVDKRIKYILIELLQNVLKNQSQEHADKSHFVLEQKDGSLHIEISNCMKEFLNGKNKEKEIIERIEEVNELPLESEEGRMGIKELYKQKFNDSTFTESGGGGLGFVDVARKIKTIDPNREKVYEYEFVDTEDENIKKFILNIDIPIKEKEVKK